MIIGIERLGFRTSEHSAEITNSAFRASSRKHSYMQGAGEFCGSVKITTEATSHEKMQEIWIKFCWPGPLNCESKGPRGIDK